MYNLVFANQKGGAGKTTSAIAVGQALTLAGHRVLYVDCDPQGNLTRAVMQDEPGAGLFEVLTGNAPLASIIKKARNGAIIAADSRLTNLNTNERADLRRLRNRLNAVKNDYDIAVFDTAPSVSMLTMYALFSADGIVVPVTPDRFAVDGLTGFNRTIQQTKAARIGAGITTPLSMLGVILTQFNNRATLHKNLLTVMMQELTAPMGTKVYLPPVRRTVAASEWTFDGDVYGSTSTAGEDYQKISTQIVKDIGLTPTSE